MNEHTEALHSSRRPESDVMPHSTVLDSDQLLFGHLVHVYIHWSNCSLTRLTGCKPYVLRKRTCPKMTLSLSRLLLHSIGYFESDLHIFRTILVLQTYQSYHSLLRRMAVVVFFFAIIWSTATIPQAQFTQFFANSHNIRIFTLRYPDFWLP